MKVPVCKLCRKAHWAYEPHALTAAMEEVRKLGASVLGYEKRIPVFPDPNPPESVTTATDGPMVYIPINRTKTNNRTNKRTRGRPRKWASEADRLRAYRERSRG